MDEKIAKYDKGGSFKSQEQLPEQFAQAWNEIQNLEYPQEYKNIRNIIIAGMGGSAYSYYVLQSLFGKELNLPVFLSNSYSLPKFADKHSLVIASSYSGTTEETISGAEEALQRNAKLTFISSGGKLKEIADANNLAGYFFDPKHNPAGQPRMGQGYMLLGTIGMLRQIGLIELDNNTALHAIDKLKTTMNKLSQDALQIAPKLKNEYLMYIGAEHLAGNAHIIRNQTNETAKQFAMYALIPELNHHLMEGLTYPKENKPYFVFFKSDNYSKRIQKRFELTEDVVKQNEAGTLSLNFTQGSKLAEFMSVLAFGGYLTFYLAMEYEIDPAQIPWVDYFKKKLAE